ncbi:7-carboxy-7-deazaguanine synthase [mine drainage metagenome]|uniref:7-carboxy-7-deazaguanine synthase n=1 Tax=mine drainage metagenome TaxID=410659 RepID=A0A1J5TCS4_9ZZZZ
MLVSEIFHSIQGEGELTGVPSVFVRTSGCNLRCAWCDTPYASWNPEGAVMTVDSIVAEVGRHACGHVVLTGGEPMVAPQIVELATELKMLGYHITIETAGTLPPGGIACDLASISPKLLNSAPSAIDHPAWHKRHELERWKPEVVCQWLDAYAFQLKFVVVAPGDLEEIEGMLKRLGGRVPPHKVLLMPEARSLDVMRGRANWLVELCKDRGYRYAHRLHIELWGNRRGV